MLLLLHIVLNVSLFAHDLYIWAVTYNVQRLQDLAGTYRLNLYWIIAVWQMEEMFLRKKKWSSNNKNSWPLHNPQNQLAATVDLGFLPVGGDGTGIDVAVVTVVEKTAVEELSSRPLPAEKACPNLSFIMECLH